MANPKPFDETLYRLVEQDDAAAGAAELKSRIDAEPEFAAAFDRTRKTVLALQGLAPKPADRPVGTFGQRDFDKLTRGVVRSYEGKLAQVFLDLGTSYLLETPQKGFGISSKDPVLDSAQNELRLNRTAESYRSISGKEALVGRNPFVGEGALDKSIVCFQASKVLRPRYSIAWSREAQAFLRKGSINQAGSSVRTALALVQSENDFELANAVLSAQIYFLGKYSEMRTLIDECLLRCPSNFLFRYNRAVALQGLGDEEAVVKSWEALLPLVVENTRYRDIFQSGFASEAGSGNPKLRGKAFDRFKKSASIYLGDSFVAMIEVVS